MANTTYAMLGQFKGTSWATAFGIAQGVPALDLLHILSPNGESILLNVDSTGAVHNPAVSPTTTASGVSDTNVGAFKSNISSGTTAQLFAATFTNLSNQDILQLISPTGGSILNYIDYQGVSH